jgi:predicted nucleic acid-binding protein
LWISVITLGEVVKGRVDGALKFQEKKDESRVREMYSGLFRQYSEDFQGLGICDYTNEAYQLMIKMPQTVKSSDRRIAAIALAHGFKVATHDLRDFPQLMPSGSIVDWTIDPKFGTD